MAQNSGLSKSLRFIGILLMTLTAGFTLLGGAGTSCVAFNPTGFGPSMARLASFQWLYILFVITGIAIGVMGVRAVVMLIKGHGSAYRFSVITLAAGTVVGVIHILVSRSLRGSSMPVDAVVYTTVLTLVVFLLLRIPSVWAVADFSKGKGKDNQMAGGLAAIVLGLLTLTIQYSMGPTHTWGGVNYASAFNATLTVLGVLLLVSGAGLAARSRLRARLMQGSQPAPTVVPS